MDNDQDKNNLADIILGRLIKALTDVSLHAQCADCVNIRGSKGGPRCVIDHSDNKLGNCQDYETKKGMFDSYIRLINTDK